MDVQIADPHGDVLLQTPIVIKNHDDNFRNGKIDILFFQFKNKHLTKMISQRTIDNCYLLSDKCNLDEDYGTSRISDIFVGNDIKHFCMLSSSPYLTEKIIKRYFDKPWDYNRLIENPHISNDFVRKNIDKPW